MRINSQAVALSAVLLGIPAVGVAQTAPQHEWSHGTTINGFAGVASDPSKNGAVLGGAVGWELTPLFALEGTGAWFDRGGSVDAFAGALKALVTLAPGHRAMPFLQAGIGLYRASFERFDGPMPEFYRRRLPAGMSHGQIEAFTDPTFVFGGGANVFLTKHVALRPDVEVMRVMRGGHHYTLTSVAVHLGYHFEDHPVTPARRK